LPRRSGSGCASGAAIGAAFGAPLTGAFYAFEIVIGAYAPAALAPVAAAALAAVVVTRTLGIEPYLIVVSAPGPITTIDYLLYVILGVICALVGIAIMQLQTATERLVSRIRLPAHWRPVLGGLIMIPIAWTTPQALSSGHGALHLELALQPPVAFLLFVFLMKALASVVSLSFGFRGGLFFASLFLGSLLGPIYAQLVSAIYPAHPLGNTDAALVGMAALSVAIVGAPMTLSMLVLETTNDFALTGVVIAASLSANAFTRSQFGYSFSTWRLHLRGSPIRSARDIGWTRALTAARLMRRDPTRVDASLTIAGFRAAVPLGSTGRVLLSTPDREYRGLVATAAAYDPALDPETPISALAQLQEEAVSPGSYIDEIFDKFEQLGVEDLAVVDEKGRILGVLTEKYVHRRYVEESEKALSELFGE
jgi:CIC family chloride channel protein